MTVEAVEIVLVEDDLADAKLAMRALQENKLGNRIQVLRDGEEALDFVFCRGLYSGRHLEDLPKLILLDLKLPKVDGLEVLREIKSDIRTKSIPVVVLTSSKEERDMVSSYRLGVNSYIQKPVEFDQFRDIVKQLGLYWVVVNQLPPPSVLLSK